MAVNGVHVEVEGLAAAPLIQSRFQRRHFDDPGSEEPAAIVSESAGWAGRLHQTAPSSSRPARSTDPDPDHEHKPAGTSLALLSPTSLILVPGERASIRRLHPSSLFSSPPSTPCPPLPVLPHRLTPIEQTYRTFESKYRHTVQENTNFRPRRSAPATFIYSDYQTINALSHEFPTDPHSAASIRSALLQRAFFVLIAPFDARRTFETRRAWQLIPSVAVETVAPRPINFSAEQSLHTWGHRLSRDTETTSTHHSPNLTHHSRVALHTGNIVHRLPTSRYSLKRIITAIA